MEPAVPDDSWLSRVVSLFLRPELAGLAMAFATLAGVVALYATPREEEPQIVVPLADVFVEAPGLSAQQVERHVATRVEKLVAEIDGVEHVYSISQPGRAVVTVRFFVGEDREESLLELQTKLHANVDRIPRSVAGWVVKPVEIDDVPIWVATLWSDDPTVDDHTLRRVAEELEIALKEVAGTNATSVVGGRPRVVSVELDPEALAARRTSPLDVAWALSVSNTRQTTAGFDQADRHVVVEAGARFASAEALRDAVVNVVDATPVPLRDVARVSDGPDERRDATWIAFGPADPVGAKTGQAFPAVHLAVAKQRGTNAVSVARALDERLAALAPSHLPKGAHVRVIRNYGETANDKVNELLRSLLEAMVIVVALLVLTLGWRESLVVALAVPLTFGLTLALNWAFGFTINRVTLFALILSLGLVVDDPIVDVENIHRHVHRARPGGAIPRSVIRRAVNEVRPPILLATAAVVISFLPMLFITGMMGPYMRPMAINVPVAMAVSMAVAFCVTPFLAWRLLRAPVPVPAPAPAADDPVRRRYARMLSPLLDDRRKGTRFLGLLGALFAFSLVLAAVRAVPLKMLPFDDKSELAVVIDLPESATLERTESVARALAAVLQRAPEVEEVAGFVGLASPMDFNGLVRHSFLRRGPNVADLRIGLVPKNARALGSHELALRLRPELEAVARAADARIAIVEVPPGPPVLATITAEVYGDPGVPYEALRDGAVRVAARLAREPAVSDVDTTVEHPSERLVFETNRTKAALSGVSTEDVARTVSLALDGLDVGEIHRAGEVNPLPIRLRVARARRSGSEGIASLPLQGRPGIAKEADPNGGLRAAPAPTVRLGELGELAWKARERAIYRKDLRRVAFVYAEPVGRPPAEVVADVAADLDADRSSDPTRAPVSAPADTVVATSPATNAAASVAEPRPLGRRTYLTNGGGLPWSLPEGVHVEWLGEGELAITRDVFRDLGAAFGVALLGIYGLLVLQTRSAAMPLVLMISIPLTLIGILPGFWLLGLFRADVAGSANPVFFTATAMIGVIALSGIAVRNAILLIEFLHRALAGGDSLREALIEAGAVRLRPIALTAGAALLAAVPITFDPIFAGLAWSFIFGLVVSTAFTLLVVPVVYDRVYRDRPGHGLPVPRAREDDDD